MAIFFSLTDYFCPLFIGLKGKPRGQLSRVAVMIALIREDSAKPNSALGYYPTRRLQSYLGTKRASELA
jgi:hypothetical protein